MNVQKNLSFYYNKNQRNIVLVYYWLIKIFSIPSKEIVDKTQVFILN